MAVTSKELFESANRYFDKMNPVEADYRGCISRAYYAAYHGARHFQYNLPSVGKMKPNCGEHENLIHMLSNPTVSASDINHSLSIELSNYLKKMLFNRRLADYQLDNVVTHKNVEITFAEAQLIFDITDK